MIRGSGRALRAEWTKLRTVRSTGWLMLGLAEDTVRLSLTGVYIGQIATAVLAVLAVGGEYSTGTIQATLAATPRRWVALAAKVLVVAATVVGAAALAVAGTFLVSRLILPDHGYAAPSLSDAATARAAGGTVLYLGLIALLSLGIAYALRDTAASIATILGLLYALPIVASLVNDEQWRRWILRLAPMTAGLSIQATRHLDALPLRPWPGPGVLGAYVLVAMIVGGLLFRLRDA